MMMMMMMMMIVSYDIPTMKWKFSGILGDLESVEQKTPGWLISQSMKSIQARQKRMKINIKTGRMVICWFAETESVD